MQLVMRPFYVLTEVHRAVVEKRRELESPWPQMPGLKTGGFIKSSPLEPLKKLTSADLLSLEDMGRLRRFAEGKNPGAGGLDSGVFIELSPGGNSTERLSKEFWGDRDA